MTTRPAATERHSGLDSSSFPSSSKNATCRNIAIPSMTLDPRDRRLSPARVSRTAAGLQRIISNSARCIKWNIVSRTLGIRDGRLPKHLCVGRIARRPDSPAQHSSRNVPTVQKTAGQCCETLVQSSRASPLIRMRHRAQRSRSGQICFPSRRSPATRAPLDTPEAENHIAHQDV